VRIVLYTNVLVSGLIGANAPPGRIVDLMRTGIVEAVFDDRIMSEYRDVLHRDYLQRYFSRGDIEDTIDYFEHNSHYVACDVVVVDLPDAGDIPFLEVALCEEVPLVTGNKKHYPNNKRRGCEVLNPREFLHAYFG